MYFKFWSNDQTTSNNFIKKILLIHFVKIIYGFCRSLIAVAASKKTVPNWPHHYVPTFAANDLSKLSAATFDYVKNCRGQWTKFDWRTTYLSTQVKRMSTGSWRHPNSSSNVLSACRHKGGLLSKGRGYPPLPRTSATKSHCESDISVK